MRNNIPVNEPLLNGNEKKYLIDCIETGWISSEGPFVQRFEEAMAKQVDRKFGISVCNGTVGLELAVRALSFEPGDEIIMPSFTIISCAAAIVRNQCVPILVDCDPVTWNMDVTLIEEKITSRTKAIMVVHIYGLPVDLDPLLELSRKYNLKVIEDAAQMHGQTYNGNPCGSFGDISIFSFYPNKHVTTGEGGMVMVNDPNLAERCYSLRNLAFQPQRRFVHEELGYNYRMTNLQAALGLAQLERLDDFITLKRRMGNLYTELLSHTPGIQLPLESTEYADNIYWVYGIVLTNDIDMNAEQFMKRLAKYQIGTRPFFWPMHEQPIFEKMGYFANQSYPHSENIARRGFYLPSGLAITEEQIEQVVSAVKDVLREVN